MIRPSRRWSPSGLGEPLGLAEVLQCAPIAKRLERVPEIEAEVDGLLRVAPGLREVMRAAPSACSKQATASR